MNNIRIKKYREHHIYYQDVTISFLYKHAKHRFIYFKTHLCYQLIPGTRLFENLDSLEYIECSRDIIHINIHK